MTPVEILVLGKPYRIACTESERDDLLESARYLDQKMREVRDVGRVVGLDRIAVMAALNITHELKLAYQNPAPDNDKIVGSLLQMQQKIDILVKRMDSE